MKVTEGQIAAVCAEMDYLCLEQDLLGFLYQPLISEGSGVTKHAAQLVTDYFREDK